MRAFEQFVVMNIQDESKQTGFVGRGTEDK